MVLLHDPDPPLTCATSTPAKNSTAGSNITTGTQTSSPTNVGDKKIYFSKT